MTTAAPSSRFFAIWTTPRASGFARNEPAVQRLNEPIAGPLQIWKSVRRVASPSIAQRLASPRYQRKTSAILCFGSRSARASSSGSRRCQKARVSSQIASRLACSTSRSSRARTSAGIASSDACSRYASYSFAARTPNIVPRLSTWTFTPSSNMSAAGAMITSATSASASIALPASDRPASSDAWFTEPVTTYAAPSANAAATAPGVPSPPAAPTRIGRV